MREVDVVIFGAGSAGMSAYRALKRANKSCILIENHLYGTTCARVGCMPSKLLIAAAHAAHDLKKAHQFGIHTDLNSLEINRSEVMRRIRQERDRFVGFVLEDIHDFPKEDMVLGNYHFINENTIESENGKQIQAKRFVIATGQKPFILPVFSNIPDRILDTEDFFNFHILPKSVAVIGTGAIGLEIGQSLTRLGVKTTILGIDRLIGTLTDPELLNIANEIFKGECRIFNEANILSANLVNKPDDEYEKVVELHWEENDILHTEHFEYILSATGTVPNLASLNLEATPLKFEKKRPVYNRQTLQCVNQDDSSSNFFIAGDITGERMILHEAIWEGQFVGKNVVESMRDGYIDSAPNLVMSRKIKTALGVIFTDPQICMVGKTYSELTDEHAIGRVDYTKQGRSRIELKNYGALHIYGNRETRQIVGCEMCGPAAEHIGHLIAWAIEMGLTVEQALEMPFYHPVKEEGVRTALRDLQKEFNEREI